jgi:hypothetical protein
MRRPLALAAAAAAVALLVAAGCSGGGGSSSGTTTTTAKPVVLRLDLIPAAVAAVEAARGGPQQYTEINAFDQGVNLFVATGDGNELAYVYRDGTGLEAPAAPQPASGSAFATTGVALDTGARLPTDVTGRLPGSRPVTVSLEQRPDSGLVWDVSVIGAKGSPLEVLYTPQGALLSVIAAQ